MDDLRAYFYGGNAPWRPTLILVREEGVQAWTGSRMAMHLMQRLGSRATIQIVQELGRIRESQVRQEQTRSGIDELKQVADSAGNVLSRKNFLRLVGGIAFAAGLTVAGQTPAFASSEFSRARSWVAANLGNLPTTYDQICTYPVAYRKAIVAKLDRQTAGNLWIAQLNLYKDNHPTMSDFQLAVVNDTVAFIPVLFGTPDSRTYAEQMQVLEAASKSAFGIDAAGNLFAHLGQDEPDSALAPTSNPICGCSRQSDYCGSGKHCGYIICNYQSGCGWLYQYTCDGLCFWN